MCKEVINAAEAGTSSQVPFRSLQPKPCCEHAYQQKEGEPILSQMVRGTLRTRLGAGGLRLGLGLGLGLRLGLGLGSRVLCRWACHPMPYVSPFVRPDLPSKRVLTHIKDHDFVAMRLARFKCLEHFNVSPVFQIFF